ncbi:hypothetical protein CDD83_5351 [Cordyceps sp. RAO-2017]|nr:hypothetical protein CDD83_5351 [Cordyceps sp. RAO-2017]
MRMLGWRPDSGLDGRPVSGRPADRADRRERCEGAWLRRSKGSSAVSSAAEGVGGGMAMAETASDDEERVGCGVSSGCGGGRS